MIVSAVPCFVLHSLGEHWASTPPLKMLSRISNYLGILLSLSTAVHAAISQTGQTVVVNGINYYVAPTSMTIITLTADQKASASRGDDIDLVPITVLGDPTNLFTTAVFRSLVSNYTTTDDVFNTGFLQGNVNRPAN
jgi:hypothetical protein